MSNLNNKPRLRLERLEKRETPTIGAGVSHQHVHDRRSERTGRRGDIADFGQFSVRFFTTLP